MKPLELEVGEQMSLRQAESRLGRIRVIVSSDTNYRVVLHENTMYILGRTGERRDYQEIFVVKRKLVWSRVLEVLVAQEF